MARYNEEAAEIDTLVGQRLHDARMASGLSRQQLARKIGITHQQLQKYEKGQNRVSAGRLYQLAKALKRELAYFFDGELRHKYDHHQRMCIEVSRNFMKISNSAHQEAINTLTKSLTEE